MADEEGIQASVVPVEMTQVWKRVKQLKAEGATQAVIGFIARRKWAAPDGPNDHEKEEETLWQTKK